MENAGYFIAAIIFASLALYVMWEGGYRSGQQDAHNEQLERRNRK